MSQFLSSSYYVRENIFFSLKNLILQVLDNTIYLTLDHSLKVICRQFHTFTSHESITGSSDRLSYKSIHNRKCHHILFYHLKKLLYQLYYIILQYTQHPKTLLFYHFIKILFFNLSLLFLSNSHFFFQIQQLFQWSNFKYHFIKILFFNLSLSFLSNRLFFFFFFKFNNYFNSHIFNRVFASCQRLYFQHIQIYILPTVIFSTYIDPHTYIFNNLPFFFF